MIVPELNELTCHILTELRRGRGEMYYPYSAFEGPPHHFSRKQLKQAIDVLKVMGIVEYARGLMTDEGEVAGSGFGIPYGEAYNTAELAIYRYKFGSLDKIPHAFVLPDRIVIGGQPYVKQSEAGDAS